MCVLVHQLKELILKGSIYCICEIQSALSGLLLKHKEHGTATKKQHKSQRKFSEVRVGFILDARGKAHIAV